MSKLNIINNPDADYIFYCYKDKGMALVKLNQQQIQDINNVNVECPECKKPMEQIGWQAYQ